MGVALGEGPQAKCFLNMPVLITDCGDTWIGSVWLMIPRNPEGVCKPRGRREGLNPHNPEAMIQCEQPAPKEGSFRLSPALPLAKSTCLSCRSVVSLSWKGKKRYIPTPAETVKGRRVAPGVQLWAEPLATSVCSLVLTLHHWVEYAFCPAADMLVSAFRPSSSRCQLSLA